MGEVKCPPAPFQLTTTTTPPAKPRTVIFSPAVACCSHRTHHLHGGGPLPFQFVTHVDPFRTLTVNHPLLRCNTCCRSDSDAGPGTGTRSGTHEGSMGGGRQRGGVPHPQPVSPAPVWAARNSHSSDTPDIQTSRGRNASRNCRTPRIPATATTAHPTKPDRPAQLSSIHHPSLIESAPASAPAAPH